MIRSMTGFGAAEGAVGSARVAVEVRSVNHRFFNPSIKLPASLARCNAAATWRMIASASGRSGGPLVAR